MAEGGLISELLGGEAETETTEALEHAALADGQGLAAGLALDVAHTDPKVSRAALGFLERQSRLLDLQAEHARAEHPLRLSFLHDQAHEGRLRRVGQRIRVGIQAFTVLVLTAIGLAVLAMFYDALTSRTVVVEAFQAPPALAGRGVNGKVVATQVLDALQKLQEATRSSAKGLNTRGAWAGDVRIEVPETGVSIGEVNRLLHERFGHDLHIDGDLIQGDGANLRLTVRGDGVPAQTFESAEAELDKLATQAAEYVYGRSQPLRYVAYLEDVGRDKDALAFLPGAFARAQDDGERAKLANTWGNSYLDLFQPGPAAEKYRLEMSLSPARSDAWWKAWCNLIGAASAYQGEEAGWREGQAFVRAVAAAPKAQRPELRLMANAAGPTWDVPLALASIMADLAAQGGAITTLEGPQVAEAYAMMHDPGHAERYMASSDPEDPTAKSEALMLQGYAALDRNDPAAAVAPLEAAYKLWSANPSLQASLVDQPCFLGLAYGLLGRRAEAEAVFGRIPNPWSRCWAFHGYALARMGDVTGAQRVWFEGVRLTPDLPNVYLARGRWEMERGDLSAAEADLSAASLKAPHFADPWKSWGDLLARQGDWRGAVAKYDVALKSAPFWIDLRRAREAAAAHR